MQIQRSASRLTAQVLAAGVLVTGLTVVTPDVYYDMHHTVIHNVVVVDSVTTTPGTTPDVYYDM